jgi:hypothetical protein
VSIACALFARGAATGVLVNAPSVHIIDHAIYHTDIDTPALVPEPGLEAAVRSFARIIDDVNEWDLSQLKASTPNQ